MQMSKSSMTALCCQLFFTRYALVFFFRIEDVLVSKKRKAVETVESLKIKLRDIGMPTCGRKEQLTARLTHASAVRAMALAAQDHVWSVAEFNVFTANLAGVDVDEWEPSEVNLVFPVLTSRSVSTDVAKNVGSMELYNKISAYFFQHLRFIETAKHSVTADELLPMIHVLRKKRPEKWTVANINLLREHMSGVNLINKAQSSPAAFAEYVAFCPMLEEFYRQRPDMMG